MGVLSLQIMVFGANVEDVQTDKHIPYEQNELQQTLEN